MDDILNLILEPMKALFLRFKTFFPNFLAMLVILAAGIVLALLIRRLLVRFLVAVKFDSWSDRSGFTKLMREGGLWSKPSAICGGLVFWLLIVVTLMSALNVLQIPAIEHLVDQFFGYIPRLISAAVILIGGSLFARFFSRTVLIAAANSGLHYAKLLAQTVHALLIVMILAMVLEQLEIAPVVVLAAFSIIFGGIVAALAIAFGVGGINAARRIIEKELENRPENQPDDVEHL